MLLLVIWAVFTKQICSQDPPISASFRLLSAHSDNTLVSVETDGADNERVEDFELRSCQQTQQ